MLNKFLNEKNQNGNQRIREINESISNSSQKMPDKFAEEFSEVINKQNDLSQNLIKHDSKNQKPDRNKKLSNHPSMENLMSQSHQEQKIYIQQLQQKIQQLQNQIQKLHESYHYQLEEQSKKVNEKNQFFLNLIQQIHGSHNQELSYYKNLILEFDEQKKQINNIETKMNHIGSGIEDILRESAELTKTNEQLEAKLAEKDHSIQQIMKQMQKYKATIEQYQLMIDQYQKLKLKANKFNRDIVELLDETEKQIANTKKKQDVNNEICNKTNVKKKYCQHCRLSNLSDKYSKMLEQEQ